MCQVPEPSLNLTPLLFIVTTLCLQIAKVEAEEESLVIKDEDLFSFFKKRRRTS